MTIRLLSPILFLSIVCLQDATLLAAGETGWGWLDPIGRWFNLLVLAGGILYFIRKPAQRFFAERRMGIQAEIQKADRARQEIEERLAEMDKRMASLNAELEAIRQQAEKEAEADRLRLVEEAEKEAQKIVEHARAEIAGMSRAAGKDLRMYASELALGLAEDKLRQSMDSSREEYLTKKFLEDLRAGRRE